MATRISQEQLNKFISPEAAMAPYDRAEKQRAQQSQQDAALAQLIKGDELKQQGMARQISEAERLRGQYGPEANVNVEGVSIGGIDPLNRLLKARELGQPRLTPAQETSEKEAGKKLSAYEVSGGSPAMQKQMQNQESVLKELQGGKRDLYDRAAGKLLGGVPGVMGVFAPSEKARMDRVQAAAIQNIRATDPNPTQVLIDQTLSRAYDPRASDEQNIARIQADYAAARETQKQMEQASQNLQRSGYTMPGLAGNPAQPVRGAAAPQPAQQQGPAPGTPEHFKLWKKSKGL